jgi:hypothetical protein
MYIWYHAKKALYNKVHMKKLIVAALLLTPSFVFGAGFAKDPIFLSKTPVTEGQSVHVYAVISNTDAGAFTGTLIFYDNSTKIGSTAINLAAGATQTASVLWTPTAGPHPLSAQLVAKDGTIAEQVAQSFTVTAKPQPVSAIPSTSSGQAAASIDSSAAIQKDIAGVSPQVASATEPAFNAVDSVRNSFADVLDAQIATAKAKVQATPKPGIVAGASTANTFADAQLANPATGAWYWVYTIYLWILQAVRWLVGSAGAFYPVVAIAFLYFIYRMYRRFKR